MRQDQEQAEEFVKRLSGQKAAEERRRSDYEMHRSSTGQFHIGAKPEIRHPSNRGKVKPERTGRGAPKPLPLPKAMRKKKS